MERRSFVRMLREVFQTAHNTSADGHTGEGGTRAGIAMLIDAENMSPGHMDEVLRLARRHGEVTRRLAFGRPTEGKWTAARSKHAIRWGSQSHVNTGKNSADIELTITAMDLLHEQSVAAFCIVSSDSDFTPLVMRLREAGRVVIGFGEKKCSSAFVESCDHFETISAVDDGPGTRDDAAGKPNAQHKKKKPSSKTTAQKAHAATNAKGNAAVSAKARKKFLNLVKTAETNSKTNDGWVPNSALGEAIRKIEPNIRYRDYGHRTLKGVLKLYPHDIETKRENKVDLVRVKRP